MLYPQENETREVKDLSGIWNFKLDRNGLGHSESWFASPLADTISMPVPASYNDITPEAAIRDHIGEVWYERSFFVPSSWHGKRVCLRFASADHSAIVWVNGKEVTRHRGGFLPFEAEISEVANYGAENRVTVALDNTLTWDTLPSGFIKTFDDGNHPPGYKSQEYQFDFFNYSGLHRPVVLTATSKTRINDITVRTLRDRESGIVDYTLDITDENATARVTLLDEEGKQVSAGSGTSGSLTISKVRLWEPGNAYLYTFEVEILDEQTRVSDVYRLPVGVRTVEVTANSFIINGKPFYFKG